MEYLIFILITLALLGGFFALTNYEARRGVRVFATHRARLDRNIERIEFILGHVDLGAFLRDEIHHFARRIGHDSVHLSLIVVRATERLLTRLIRYFHTRQATDTTPHENVREFVKTLSDFKGGLKATHPEVGEIK
ncbi:MAG: hypothetical protein Q8P23_04335 [bacterium]|nr:hypothetical protein [bacterium]